MKNDKPKLLDFLENKDKKKYNEFLKEGQLIG